MPDKFKILQNDKIAKGIYKMRLAGDTGKFTRPGQFMSIELDGFYLRRPISVCDLEDGVVTIIYKIFGGGTEYMSALPAGKELDILTGLGNGFDISKAGERPLLVGGGVGVPPLWLLAKKLVSEGKRPAVLLGFGSAEDVFYDKDFASLGCKTLVATNDGTAGKKGFVTDLLSQTQHDYIFACGPVPMLKALYHASDADGQYSFEERMGCAVGACMGCVQKTVLGYKRICKDGPVLQRREIAW